MKKPVAVLLMLAMPCVISAQSVNYSYDIAGNRIKREIVMKTRALQQEESTTECYSDMLSERTIRIYPNPTKGKLRVEIAGYENSDQSVLRIFNVSGQQILSTHVTSSWTEVDISSQTNGIYILHLSLNSKETTWKIIKK